MSHQRSLLECLRQIRRIEMEVVDPEDPKKERDTDKTTEIAQAQRRFTGIEVVSIDQVAVDQLLGIKVESDS